jgi:hypothetical protein
MSRATCGIVLMDEDKNIINKYFSNGPTYSNITRREGEYELLKGNRDMCYFIRKKKFDSPYGQGWKKSDVEDELYSKELKYFTYNEIPWNMLTEVQQMIAKKKFK